MMQSNDRQILLLGESEAALGLERRALRELGYGQVMGLTSGIDAAKFLARINKPDNDWYPDLVICSQKLADMDGEQFCAIIRQHPRLLALPILLIMPNDSEAEQLKTLGCGASCLLARPYSLDKLKKDLDLLFQNASSDDKLRMGAQQTDTSAFDAALATYGILLRPNREPEDYFKVGMNCLEEKQWNCAINAFQLALSNAHIKAEAELGMAAAFKGKGDMRRFQGWLARAAETLVEAKRWHLARTAYAKLLRHAPDAKNPFLARAHQLMKQKNYDEAAKTLVEALAFIPGGKAGDRFAKICFAAADPDAMLKALENSLADEGGNKADALTGEIRQSLEILAKERQENQRRLAAERKWQLSRMMSDKNSSSSSSQIMEKKVPESSKETASVVPFDEEDLTVQKEELYDEEGEVAAEDHNTQVIAPLTRTEAISEIFTEKPKINELLSVIKLTWNLAKRTKNKK